MKDEFFPTETLNVPGDLLLPLQVVRKPHFDEAASRLAGSLLDEHSTLEAYVIARNLSEILEVVQSQLKEGAIALVEGKSQEVLGAMVQLKSLPKKWEYDDGELRKLEADKAAIDVRLKSRKKFLETIKEETIDHTTGEIIRPARCISDGVTIQVTF